MKILAVLLGLAVVGAAVVFYVSNHEAETVAAESPAVVEAPAAAPVEAAPAAK